MGWKNMARFAGSIVVLASALGVGCGGSEETPGTSGMPMAKANISAKSGSQVEGTATFEQQSTGIVVMVLSLSNMPAGDHAVHIHKVGDCSSPDAESAGEHWNPTNAQHGQWGSGSYHLGDIGNITASSDGKVNFTFRSDKWTIGSDLTNDIVDKSLVVHADPDDYTTQPGGNAGIRIGCGVIEKSP